MLYRILADLVVMAHLLFILFALLGGGLLLWRRYWLLVHLPAAIWVSLISFKGWICPLTPLENHFRIRAGQQGYGGGFVEHYIIPLIYPAGLTTQLQLILGIVALAINVVVYGWVLYRLQSR
jgi:hypothetical protein